MKAYKYQVTVYNGVLAYSHNMGFSTTEIFIPKKKLIFNYADKRLHIFRADEPRNSEYKEIEFDSSLAHAMEEYLEIKDRILQKVIDREYCKEEK